MSELRTKLASDSSGGSGNSAAQREILDAIIRNAKRLQRLTKNILDVTKIESQSLVLRVERFDLDGVIMNAIHDVTASSDYLKKQGSVEILYDPRHIFVNVDKIRLVQVVSNLLSNFIKFTSEGSVSIVVVKERTADSERNNGNIGAASNTITTDDDVIVVSIQDMGQGIDPEMLPLLFSRFSSDSSSGGTGLGLFISKGIIEAHGGKIWARNIEDEEGRRKGAAFTFTLPITNRQERQLVLLSSSMTPLAAAATASLSSSPYLIATTGMLAGSSDNKNSSSSNNDNSKSRLEKMTTTPPGVRPLNGLARNRILIVDDEEGIIFTLKNVLEKNGFEIDSFNSAFTALEKFAPNMYAVAILDIRMPQMNGFELYEKIRKMIR